MSADEIDRLRRENDLLRRYGDEDQQAHEAVRLALIREITMLRGRLAQVMSGGETP